MKLYLIRHGETVWNAFKRLQGSSDVALNRNGCELAIKTGRKLSDVAFSKVFSSPYIRAYHTAELILSENKTSSSIEIIKDVRLQEMSFGIYEGHCYSEENWDMPDDNFKNFFQNCGQYRKPEGGESFEDVITRARLFVAELSDGSYCETDNILLTSHGALIKGIINAITGNPVSEFWGDGVHQNCGVTIIEFHEEMPPHILMENITFY